MPETKLYRVRVKEVWEQVYIVLADSPEEALKNGQSCRGVAVESEFEYDRTLVTDDIAMVEEVVH